ncbi:MAG: exodeoxyribonuclease VII large subunit [Butyricicoccus sp.]
MLEWQRSATVSQLNNEIKDLLDAVPGYRGLMVQGEISNYKAHSSGHHYMTLKDENAAINAVMFRSDAMRLKFRLQNGMKVIVKARVSSFPRTGAVQLYVSEIIPDGAGALNLAFEQLKANCRRKVCSSGASPSRPVRQYRARDLATGAVRDMIRILGRRWPLAKVVLYPAVQGQGAAESIARIVHKRHRRSRCHLCGRAAAR